MRPLTRFLSFAVPTLLLADALGAQARIPYNQRVQWAPPPVVFDSTTVQLRVVDAVTGEAVPALLCFRNGNEAVTDRGGEVRVSGIRGRNVSASVVASGRHAESLIFQPGMRGRSFATVRLERSGSAPERPTCKDARFDP